jgi:hybrid cluster-associated redox disulfide protein
VLYWQANACQYNIVGVSESCRSSRLIIPTNHMEEQVISTDLMVAYVMNEWPATVQVFLEHRMGCIGCYLSPFDSLEDALMVHGIPVEPFVAELHQVIEGSGSEKTPEDDSA